MARSHVARQLPGQVPARMRGAAAAAVVALCAVVPLLASSADAQAAAARPAARAQPASGPLTLTVTSVSPAYAEQGHQLTITGRVRNTSGSAASALSVQLLSSATPLVSRPELEKFASGGYPLGGTPVSIAPVTRLTLGAGESWNWTVTFPASALGLSCFGVYPLTAEVGDAALSVASDPVPLPYWPTKGSGLLGPAPAAPVPHLLDLAADRHSAPGCLPRPDRQQARGERRAGWPAGNPARRRQPVLRQGRTDLGHRSRPARQRADDAEAVPGRRLRDVPGGAAASSQPRRGTLAGRPGQGDPRASPCSSLRTRTPTSPR